MKKLLLTTLVLVAGIAQADFWDNCTAYGGTIITANSYGNDKGGLCNDPNNPELTNNCNGKSFCLSGKTMNWWSSFTWCEAVGGKLASFEAMCPNTTQLNNPTTGACPNLTNVAVGDLHARSSLGYRTFGAFFVRLNSGAVYDDYYSARSKSDSDWCHFRAFCEE